MYPNPPSHYAGFLNHLVWICIWTQVVLYFAGVIFHRTKASVCAHYSFSVTYSDTHAFIWRQTEWQNRFHLKRLAVCKHKIQPESPSLLHFFVPCVVILLFSLSFSTAVRLMECLLCYGSNCKWHQHCLLWSHRLWQTAFAEAQRLNWTHLI